MFENWPYVLAAFVVVRWLVWRKRRLLFSQRNRTIRRQVRGAGTFLKQRYGKQKYYTPAQVKESYAARGYSPDYLCYALATYCTSDAFQHYHRADPTCCDYSAMRSEVGLVAFGGSPPLDAASAIEAAEGGRVGGGDGSSGDSGGSSGDADGGGDSGGGSSD